MSEMKSSSSSSFDLYNRRARPVAGKRPQTPVPVFPGTFISVITRESGESFSVCFLARVRRKKCARARPDLSGSYVRSGRDIALSTKRGKKNKREGKKHIRPANRHESVRSLGVSATYGGGGKKEEEETRCGRDDSPYAARTPSFGERREGWARGVRSAYNGARCNTWHDLRAIIHTALIQA